MSVNKVILIGNLGAEPEVKYLDGNRVVANIRIATNESYTDSSGNRITQTEWHNLEMWDGLAKVVEKYLHTGDQVYVEGKIKTDTWQDKEGNNRYTTRIRVNNLTMLGKKNDNSSSPPPAGNTSQQSPVSSSPQDDEDDLPF